MREAVHSVSLDLAGFVDALGHRLQGQPRNLGANVVALNGLGTARLQGPTQVHRVIDESLAEQVLGHILDVLGVDIASAGVGQVEGGHITGEETVGLDLAQEFAVLELFGVGVAA